MPAQYAAVRPIFGHLPRGSQEADEYDLPLLKARGRRKSKDLEEQAMALLGPQLEKIFGKMMMIAQKMIIKLTKGRCQGGLILQS